jgi:hypothetical protein
MDGGRVKIIDEDDHTILYPIKVESTHIFFHLGDDIAIFIFEGKPDVVGFGSVPFLDVFFESEDGGVGLDSELRNFKG